MTASYSLRYGDPEAANLEYESRTLKYCVFCDEWRFVGDWEENHERVVDHRPHVRDQIIGAWQDGESWPLDEHGREIVDDGYRG